MPPGESADGGFDRYSLRVPCKRCPFRTDVRPYLTSTRAEDITEGLRAGGPFGCHKTTVPGEDELGQETLIDDPQKTKECLGALATTLREGWLNQPALVNYRMGLFDPSQIDAWALPVYDTLADWVRAHYDAELEEESKPRGPLRVDSRNRA